MSWQPIETAPKDETWLLLYFPSPPLMVEADGMILAFWSEEGEGWFTSEAASHPLEAFGDHPTHWQPLPLPPNSPPSLR